MHSSLLDDEAIDSVLSVIKVVAKMPSLSWLAVHCSEDLISALQNMVRFFHCRSLLDFVCTLCALLNNNAMANPDHG